VALGAHRFLYNQRAEGDALVEPHPVPDLAGLTYDDPGAMVDGEGLSDTRPGVDIDPGEAVSQFPEDPEIAIEMRRAVLTMDGSFVHRESVQDKITDWIRSGRTVSPRAADARALPQLVDATSLAPASSTDSSA
jgi:hypothetical protein